MLKTFQNAWKNPELKKRILFTLAILVVYRLGCAVPVPFVNADALAAMFGSGNMLNYLNMMSGGALSQCTLFALGVTPYINASIILQLLSVAIPALEQMLQREDGQQKFQKISRYVGAGIAVVMSLGFYFVIRNMGGLKYTTGGAAWFSAIVIIAAFTAGHQLVVWLGEQIDDKGIGSGISLMIFTSILSGWSGIITTAQDLLVKAQLHPINYLWVALLVALMLAALVFVVVLTNAERRIPIQQSGSVVGRRMTTSQRNYIPLKLNMTGVMPVIFASSLVSIPGTIGSFVNVSQTEHPIWYAFFELFDYTSLFYLVLYVVMIVLFNYFYVAIQFNPVQISEQLRRSNTAIPGYRPGKPTVAFLTPILNRITMIGGVFLAIVAGMPIILGNLMDGVSVQLGGTSLLIVVGVAVEVFRNLEAANTNVGRKGFLD